MSKKPKSLVEDLARGLWWIFAVCVLFAIGIVYMEWRFDNQLRYRIPDLAAVVDRGVEPVALVSGQKKAAYVPAYSHVYYRDGRAALLAVTLSVRNTDRYHEIALTSVRYYDSHGIVVRSHLDKTLRLKPLASAEFLIERDDTTGGGSPSFVVEWEADQTATQPLVETVMIGTQGRHGVSFARRGFDLAEAQYDTEAEPQ